MEKITGNSNTAFKILSVVFAVILWAYVAYQENPEITHWVKNVPITVVGTEKLAESGFSLTGTSRNAVDVKLKGDRLEMSKITADDILVNLDVSGIKNKGDTAVVCSVTVNHKNIDVDSARHNTVTVFTEEIVTDTYPITTTVVGTPAAGYMVFDVTASSVEVNVQGAESVISSIHHVSTKSISVNGVNSGSTVSVGMTAYDEDGKAVSGVTFDPAVVEVSYTVYKEKTVPLKISLSRIPIDKEITISPSSIKIYGDADALANVGEIISAPLDVSTANDGDAFSVQLLVPDGVLLSGGETTAEITVNVKDLEENNANDE